jgi:hypothetical protein
MRLSPFLWLNMGMSFLRNFLWASLKDRITWVLWLWWPVLVITFLIKNKWSYVLATGHWSWLKIEIFQKLVTKPTTNLVRLMSQKPQDPITSGFSKKQLLQVILSEVLARCMRLQDLARRSFWQDWARGSFKDLQKWARSVFGKIE